MKNLILLLLFSLSLSACTTTVRYRNGQWEVDARADVTTAELDALKGYAK